MQLSVDDIEDESMCRKILAHLLHVGSWGVWNKMQLTPISHRTKWSQHMHYPPYTNKKSKFQDDIFVNSKTILNALDLVQHNIFI